MTVNDAYANSANDLADTGTLIIDGSGAETGAVNITEIIGAASAEVRRQFDPDGDGTYEIDLLIESMNDGFHSQGNDLLCSQSQNVRLVIKNASGATNDYGALGYEVDD